MVYILCFCFVHPGFKLVHSVILNANNCSRGLLLVPSYSFPKRPVTKQTMRGGEMGIAGGGGRGCGGLVIQVFFSRGRGIIPSNVLFSNCIFVSHDRFRDELKSNNSIYPKWKYLSNKNISKINIYSRFSKTLQKFVKNIKQSIPKLLADGLFLIVMSFTIH